MPEELDFSGYPETETKEWLGEELIEEGNRLLNNSPNKNKLIIMYLIAKKNWLEAMEDARKTQVALNISRKDKD